MDLSAFGLAGRTILVTGANTGIGQGIALSIGRAGGKVIGVGRSDMGETAALMAEQGADFVAIRADLGSVRDAQAMFDTAWAEHGPIDGLVNNAGIIKRVDAVDFTEDDWDAVMDINLKTMFFLCQALGRKALAEGRKARIVNIASMLSFQGGIRVASYTASKSGVLGITRLLANEWAARGINVNAIDQQYRGAAQRPRSVCRHSRAYSCGTLGRAVGYRRCRRIPSRARFQLHAWRRHPCRWRLARKVI